MTLYSLVYDHDGDHKRTFLMVARHPDFDPWDNNEWFTQVAAQASIDYQLEVGSTFAITKILFNRALSASRFTVMALMLQGK